MSLKKIFFNIKTHVFFIKKSSLCFYKENDDMMVIMIHDHIQDEIFLYIDIWTLSLIDHRRNKLYRKTECYKKYYKIIDIWKQEFYFFVQPRLYDTKPIPYSYIIRWKKYISQFHLPLSINQVKTQKYSVSGPISIQIRSDTTTTKYEDFLDENSFDHNLYIVNDNRFNKCLSFTLLKNIPFLCHSFFKNHHRGRHCVNTIFKCMISGRYSLSIMNIIMTCLCDHLSKSHSRRSMLL